MRTFLFASIVIVGMAGAQAQPRFVGGLDGQTRYQAVSDVAGVPARPRELHALQHPKYPTAASVTFTQTLDSGQPNTL